MRPDAAALVGPTPLVRLRRFAAGGAAELVAKLESMQPSASVKVRIARAVVEDAEARGAIAPGGTLLVKPTSGNTGISLAYICAAKGYKLALTMPETMSTEWRVLLRAFGAALVLADGRRGMKGAVAKAEKIVAAAPGAVMLQQFENAANPAAHYAATGPEIWEATDGRVDVLIAGDGTGGTITGAGRFLRERNAAVRLVAVEPAESAVLSGRRPGLHKIEGIGAGFVPGVLDTSLLDEVVPVSSDDAVAAARRLALEEGLLGGISTGAAAHAARLVAARPENAGKRVVFVAPSFGER